MKEVADLTVVVRIEKLLAKADDAGATAEEREAFQNKAMELIARHRIDEAQIGGHLDSDDVLDSYRYGEITGGLYGRVRLNVVNVVCSANDVEIYWTNVGSGPKMVMMYGFRSDCDASRALGGRLLADADFQAQNVRSVSVGSQTSIFDGDTRQTSGSTTADRRSFYMGYADEIRSRFDLARRAAEDAAERDGVDMTSTALVLVDRAAEVNRTFRSKVKARPAGQIAAASAAGHARGRVAGANADLSSGNSVSGGRKQLGQ
jgi:hypothetical protein